MDDSFSMSLPELNLSETSLNSSFTLRRRKENVQLTAEKNKNIELAKLHQDRQIRLDRLNKNEDRLIDTNLKEFECKVNELTVEDVGFIISNLFP